LEIDGEFTASMNILLCLLLLFVLMTGCVYFVLASFISAVVPASKDEHWETNCLVVKLRYTTTLDPQTLGRSLMLSVRLFASLEVWFSRLLFGIYGRSKILTRFL
jgi:hypothetical protein